MMYVCKGCKYETTCGDMERVEDCEGYAIEVEEENCELDLTGSCGYCRKCNGWMIE